VSLIKTFVDGKYPQCNLRPGFAMLRSLSDKIGPQIFHMLFCVRAIGRYTGQCPVFSFLSDADGLVSGRPDTNHRTIFPSVITSNAGKAKIAGIVPLASLSVERIPASRIFCSKGIAVCFGMPVRLRKSLVLKTG
jgi:hypothetical protein